MARTNFTTPVGRLLMGSLYKPQTTDAEGKPLVNKSGPNIGQAKVVYFFAVGFNKGTETHWSQTPWGQVIWKAGHEAFPNVASSPHFAWKVVDGDSQIPNRNGKKPCDREDYPGKWVVSFSSGFAPKIYNKDGSSPLLEPDAVKLGYYVQVNADVDGNGSQQQPGVFVNHAMVALSAYGEEISVGPDPTSAGFGAAALPAGALATPAASFVPPAAAPAQAPAPAYAPPPGPALQPPPNPAPAYAPPPGPALQPPPNPAILQIPPVPVAAPPPAPPMHQMTAKAGASTYEQWLAQGWTDDGLRQHGYML